MRTMLISFILICSLAQLASAGASPVNSGGCGTHYTCFAPNKCLNPPAQTIMANSKVVEITISDKIMNDCDAIIRFYRYDDKKTLVSIESFQDTVKKIEFKQNKNDPNDQHYANQTDLSFFSCEIDAISGKTKGMFFDKLVMEKDITSGKLTCKFEGKRDAPWAQDNLFKMDTDWLTIITYDSNMSLSSTKPAKSRGDINVRCDPQYFDFIKPTDDRTKLYKEVSTINMPETYQCDDIAIFKMEFKKKGSDSYEEAKSIKCVDDGKVFEVFDKDNQRIEFEEAVEIRCVAETKFFCKDSFKRKDGEQFPKLAENDDGSTLLMCPTDKPYLVIAGEVERYITNPEFKCVTLGNEPIWTVKNGNREEIFTRTGPIAYCSDRKNCTQPISESAVVDGILGPDFLPKCSDSGTLKTTDNKVVTTSRCDHSDGVYKYTVGGEEKAIKDDTKFICEYPPDDDGSYAMAKDQENKEKILSGALYAGIGSTIIGLIVIVVVVFLVRRRAKLYKLDYEQKQRENQELYYTPKELAAVRDREAIENKKNQSQTTDKSKTTEKTESRVEEKFKEEAVTSLQHKCMASLKPVYGYIGVNPGRKADRCLLPSFIHVLIRDPMKQDYKSSAVIQRIAARRDYMMNGLANSEKKRAGGVEHHDE